MSPLAAINGSRIVLSRRDDGRLAEETAQSHLLVIVRIEVDVVQNNDVGGGQVDAESTRFRRQQENRYRFVIREQINQILAVADWGRTVYSQIVVLPA